jgi:TatD DNase family protein
MVAIGTGNGPPDLEAGIRLADRYPKRSTRRSACIRTTPAKPSRRFPASGGSAQHPKVVAIGEIGLDYHYDFSPREVQQRVFIRTNAHRGRGPKPIVIHTAKRGTTLFVIREHWDASLGGIMHCFSGGPAQAQQALDLGFYLSFGGIVTFPKALDIQEAARTAPLDRILHGNRRPLSRSGSQKRQAE